MLMPTWTNRPDVEHGDAHQQVDGGADDGDKAGAAEEGEHLGQLDLIEPVVEGGYTQAHDDTAEDAHLQGGDAQHRGGGVGGHGVHTACGIDHGADGGVHHQVGDGADRAATSFSFLAMPMATPMANQQGQVIEDGAARTGS